MAMPAWRQVCGLQNRRDQCFEGRMMTVKAWEMERRRKECLNKSSKLCVHRVKGKTNKCFNSLKWLTLLFCKLCAWCYTGIAILRCMHNWKQHMYTTQHWSRFDCNTWKYSRLTCKQIKYHFLAPGLPAAVKGLEVQKNIGIKLKAANGDSCFSCGTNSIKLSMKNLRFTSSSK